MHQPTYLDKKLQNVYDKYSFINDENYFNYERLIIFESYEYGLEKDRQVKSGQRYILTQIQVLELGGGNRKGESLYLKPLMTMNC